MFTYVGALNVNEDARPWFVNKLTVVYGTASILCVLGELENRIKYVNEIRAICVVYDDDVSFGFYFLDINWHVTNK